MLEFDQEAIREAAQRRLAQAGRDGGEKRLESGVEKTLACNCGASTILWGWQAIANHLDLSVDTTRLLAKEDNLPVFRGRNKMVQSTKGAINEWAERRARAMSLDMSVPIEIQEVEETVEAGN